MTYEKGEVLRVIRESTYSEFEYSNGKGFRLGEHIKFNRVAYPGHIVCFYLDDHDWWYIKDCDVEPANMNSIRHKKKKRGQV